MAYDYTLQTKLQSPTAANTRKVNADIRRSFSGFGIKFNNKDLKKATSEINKVGKAADDAGKKVKNFGDKIGSQGTSYLSYALVSGAIIRLTSAFASATNEAIKFEKELIKISQVTRKSTTDIIKNARVITDISREYGLATNKVAELTRLLAQTGLSFRQAADGARTLAKTELLASFDNLSDTTEGLIALMNSFNLSTIDAAKGLEAINAVSKRFAVESGDIVEAIKRTGGAFSAAGGDINELIALFTSVRATSRESGETIATAFRTIFGRLQRPKTIEYFKELNIELADANGNFVGGFAAIERISKGLKDLGIKAGSIKFAEVAEQVGGIRQLSKVIPLLTKFSDAQDALAVANAAASESEDDVAKAKKSLSFQIAALTADFRALIFEITQTAGFKIVATLFIETARAAIDLTRALKPLLPIFAAIGAFKGFGIASRAFQNFQGVKQQAQGFNRGGPVPGSGNGDTVPAMLEPGEFVIRKSAVQAYGTQNLAKINKYARGGKTRGSLPRDLSAGDPKLRYERFGRLGSKGLQSESVKYKDIDALGLEPAVAGGLKGSMYEKYMINRFGVSKPNGTGRFPDVNPTKAATIVREANLPTKVGNKLLDGAELKYRLSKDTAFKYRKGLRAQKSAKNIPMIYAEGEKFAKGGAVGTDTVPALLTPGEFVINRESAQAFGYGKLGEINKYAKGGPVQKFAEGTTGNGVESNKKLEVIEGGFAQLNQEVQEAADVVNESFSAFADWDAAMKEVTNAVQKNTNLNPPAKNDQSLVGPPTDPDFAKENAAFKAKKAQEAKAIEDAKNAPKPELYGPPKPSPLDIQSAANRKKGLNKNDFLSAERSKSAGPDLIGGMSASGKKQEEEFKKQAKAQSKLRKETNKLQKGFSLTTTSVLGIFGGFSVLGGILESFGFEMDAVSAAQKRNSIALFTTIAALISFSRQIRASGASLSRGKLQGIAGKFGLGGPAKKLGGVFNRLGKGLAKIGPKLAKGLGVLAAVDIAGSLASGIFAGDASKTRDAAIKSGDSEVAGSAAVEAFSQQLNNSIPIIGGFLNLLPFGGSQVLAFASGLTEAVKAGAELEATFVKNDKVFSEAFKQLSKGIGTGNLAEVNKNVKLISSATTDERSRSENLQITSQEVQANLFFGNWLGGATATIKANSETAIKGFERSSKQISAAVSQTSPFIDSYAAKLILAGKTSEEVADLINDKFSDAIGGLGLIRSPKDIADAEIKLTELRDKLRDANAKRVAQADDFWSNARKKNINDVAVAALEARETELKAVIEAGKASQAAELAAKALREEQLILNAVYRDSAKSLRVLRMELGALTDKIANADFAEELTNTKFGETSGSGALRRRFGTEELSGSLKDILRKDKGKKLENQATTFVGPEAGKQVRQGILLQKAADAVSKDITTNGTSLSKALEKAKSDFVDIDQSGSTDEESSKREKRQLTKDFLKDNIFGGNIPKELEGQIDGIVLEFSKALESGTVSAEELSKIFENGGTKLSAEAIKSIQTQLDQQAKRASMLGKKEAELFKLRLEFKQAELEQTIRGNEVLIQLGEDRINALASAGVDQKSLLGARNKNLEDSRASNISSVLPAGSTSSRVRRKAKAERDSLAKTTKQIESLDPTRPLNQDASVTTTIKSEAKLEDQRQRSIQSLKNINSALAKDNELRKKGLALQIEEANARRQQIQALNDAVGDLILEFGFGTDEQRSNLAQSATLTQSALQQGGLGGFTGDQRGSIGSFLNRFKGAGPLDILGGKTAAQVKGNFAAQEAVRAGVIKPSEFKKFADAAAKKAVPVEDRIKEVIKATYDEIEKSQKAINENEKAILASQKSEIDKFAKSVEVFRKATEKFFNKEGEVKASGSGPIGSGSNPTQDVFDKAEADKKRKAAANQAANQAAKDAYDKNLMENNKAIDASPKEFIKKEIALKSERSQLRSLLKDEMPLETSIGIARKAASVDQQISQISTPVAEEQAKRQKLIDDRNEIIRKEQDRRRGLLPSQAPNSGSPQAQNGSSNKVEHEVIVGDMSVQLRGADDLKGAILSSVLSDVGDGFKKAGDDIKTAQNQEDMGRILSLYGLQLVENNKQRGK